MNVTELSNEEITAGLAAENITPETELTLLREQARRSGGPNGDVDHGDQSSSDLISAGLKARGIGGGE